MAKGRDRVSGAAMYDPLDTVRWMLDGMRTCVLEETVPSGNGRAKKKTKAQREADRVRYETLCELVWNIEGRPEPLEDFMERLLLAA
jgi:hypothetical protein